MLYSMNHVKFLNWNNNIVVNANLGLEKNYFNSHVQVKTSTFRNHPLQKRITKNNKNNLINVNQ